MSSRRLGRRVCSGRRAVENGAPLPLLPNLTTSLKRDKIEPLSGNPYCHMILTNTNLHPRYIMGPPSNLRARLPSTAVPTVLTNGGNSWDMVYSGQSKEKKFTYKDWKNFAHDNCLKVGDACIFELVESSDEKVIFKVQILRGDIPSEFSENETIIGLSAAMPIVIS